jgi:hypothetical protein
MAHSDKSELGWRDRRREKRAAKEQKRAARLADHRREAGIRARREARIPGNESGEIDRGHHR